MLTRFIAHRFAILLLALTVLASGTTAVFASIKMMDCGAPQNVSSINVSASSDHDPDAMRDEGKPCKAKIRSIAAAATVVVATASCASLSESAGYRFEFVGQSIPSNIGTTFTVRMLNASNGQRITNAEVFATQTEYALSPKAVPWVRYERVALNPDGQGDYVYQGANIRGSEIELTAHVPGVNGWIIGTLVAPTTNSSRS